MNSPVKYIKISAEDTKSHEALYLSWQFQTTFLDTYRKHTPQSILYLIPPCSSPLKHILLQISTSLVPLHTHKSLYTAICKTLQLNHRLLNSFRVQIDTPNRGATMLKKLLWNQTFRSHILNTTIQNYLFLRIRPIITQ